MHPMRIGAYVITAVWAVLTPWAALRGDALTFALGAGVLLLAAFEFRPDREPVDDNQE